LCGWPIPGDVDHGVGRRQRHLRSVEDLHRAGTSAELAPDQVKGWSRPIDLRSKSIFAPINALVWADTMLPPESEGQR
jgi:hypothetical protein